MKTTKVTNKTKKTFIAATVFTVLTSTNALAHGNCDIDINAGVNINENNITFFDEKSKAELYSIVDDHDLIIDGKAISLSAAQQKSVSQYSKNIKTMVPKVRTLAIEGVDIAIDGVNLAFNQMLGEGNSVSTNLIDELATMRDEVSKKLTLAQGITIGEAGLESDDLLGKDFENRIEGAVEKAVMSSMGTIMMAMGREMINSGGDSESFENRMEDFGKNIEHEMESRAQKIEYKADKLCMDIVAIDNLENQLKTSIPEMAHYDVISADYHHTDLHDDNRAM